VGKGRGGGRGRAGGRGARRGRGRGRGKNPGDIGCEPGDPNNRLLPWVPHRETLPDASILGQTERLLENVTLPSFQSRPLRKCAIMVDRHVHKNGGSTVRDVFLEHERTGFALYQGYTQMYWHRDFKVMRRAAEDAVRTRRTPESVLLVEAHFGWVELAQAVLPSLRELERMYKRAGIDCPLVLMTRVREPLDYYLSFYKWGVAFRQRESPHLFGRNFIEWAQKVPNLQSTMMMQSMAAMAAEYHLDQFRMHYHNNRAVGKTDEIAWARLVELLDSFTIVGTMKRFDESLLMAHDMVGLPALLYKRNRPNQKGGYKGKNSDACPDMEACRAVIRKVAERDHKMYERYNERFEKQLAEKGEQFAQRVVAYKKAIADIQSTWRKVPRKQYICRYHPETSTGVRELRRGNIRCPIPARDGGTELCQSVYAHRLFECPWQYVPNSTLSDPLGCWRPSSGFN